MDDAMDDAIDNGMDCSRWMTSLGTTIARVQHAEGETLERQVMLSCIPAPTGDEQARRTRVRAMLRETGFTNTQGAHVREDDTGNLIARIEPARRPHAPVQRDAPVVCMAHLDTVFPADVAIEAVRRGPVITCPGIGDNGRGLAALVTLATHFAHPELCDRLRRPVEFVATVGEEGEGNLRGARAYFDRHAATDIASVVVLDGPGDTTIVHHAVASMRLRVTLSGPGGHSWIDRAAPNPIHLAANAIAAVARLGATLPRSSAVTVTRTGGGESLTSIAERAWFDIDARALSNVELARIVGDVRRIANSHAGSCHCDVRVLGDRPGGMIAREHPLTTLAADMTSWCGLAPVSAMASTDANIPLSRGIPAVAIGAGGRGGGAHTASEWFDGTDGARGVVRALGILSMLACN